MTALYLFIRTAALLRQSDEHRVRWNELDARKEAGDQLGAHIGDRLFRGLRQLLGDTV